MELPPAMAQPSSSAQQVQVVVPWLHDRNTISESHCPWAMSQVLMLRLPEVGSPDSLSTFLRYSVLPKAVPYPSGQAEATSTGREIMLPEERSRGDLEGKVGPTASGVLEMGAPGGGGAAGALGSTKLSL